MQSDDHSFMLCKHLNIKAFKLLLSKTLVSDWLKVTDSKKTHTQKEKKQCTNSLNEGEKKKKTT